MDPGSGSSGSCGTDPKPEATRTQGPTETGVVVLNEDVQPGREIRPVGEARTRIGLQDEEALSLLPVSEKDDREDSSDWLNEFAGTEKAI